MNLDEELSRRVCRFAMTAFVMVLAAVTVLGQIAASVRPRSLPAHREGTR